MAKKRCRARKDIFDTNTNTTYSAHNRTDVVIEKMYSDGHVSCFFYLKPVFQVNYAWYPDSVKPDNRNLEESLIRPNCTVEDVYPLQFFSEIRSLLKGLIDDDLVIARKAIERLIRSKLVGYRPTGERESENDQILDHDSWLLQLLRCDQGELESSLSIYDPRQLCYSCLCWVLRQSRKGRGYQIRPRSPAERLAFCQTQSGLQLKSPENLESQLSAQTSPEVVLPDWIEIEPHKHPYKTTSRYRPAIEEMACVFPEEHRKELLATLGDLKTAIDAKSLQSLDQIMDKIRPRGIKLVDKSPAASEEVITQPSCQTDMAAQLIVKLIAAVQASREPGSSIPNIPPVLGIGSGIEDDTNPIVNQTSVRDPQETNPNSNIKNALIEDLPRAWRLAYFAFVFAESVLQKEVSYSEAWQVLNENGFGECETLNGYRLPKKETFATYVSRAKKTIDEPRNRPRGARASRSVIKADEI